MKTGGSDREVVILLTDMMHYSRISSAMTPDEIRDYLVDYHSTIHSLLHREEFFPIEIEPSAGDGCLIVFDKQHGEDAGDICTRGLAAALRLTEAISSGALAPTRMGLLLGRITEARLGNRMAKFGSIFAVANRLEELCGHFGTHVLMDREVVRRQRGFDQWLVNVAKVSLTSVVHPMNIFTIYRPGIHHCPADVDEGELQQFIRMKNEAMEYFSGNQLSGVKPDFPKVREELLVAQKFFRELTGCEDAPSHRVLEYIRETPRPSGDFEQCGMKLLEKSRDALGERLFHLSKQLLHAMNPDFYHVLVEDTGWERFFKLEWHKKGEVIIRIGSEPDGVYYLDSGTVETLNCRGELLSTMQDGTIFGEMAYFGPSQKRTATVCARTDVVLRKISTEDLRGLPVVQQIFEQIANARRKEIAADPQRAERDTPSPR